MARAEGHDFLGVRARKLAVRRDGDRHHFVRAGHAAHIEVVSEDAGARTQTFRLDAKILPADKRTPRATPELERETHDILGRAIEDLKGRRFQVRRIDPVRGEDGSVLYYDVTVQR